MKKREMESRLKQAYTHAVPDLLPDVLSACEESKGTVMIMENKRKSNPWFRRAAAIAASLAILAVGAVGAYHYQSNLAVASTVSLDVNPSIQIKVNQKERVLSVEALNGDGQIVLGDMDFSGSELDVTVNALIGSMLRNGYLSEIANSILISVDNRDPDKGAALRERLTQEVAELLKTETFNGAVLSQTISVQSELQTLADQYGVTAGKAQLIQKILENNPLYTFETLAALSINELNLLCADRPVESIDSVGNASDKSYIGADRAREIALANAGLSADAVTQMKVSLDLDDGLIVYEVEFVSGGYEYEYDINAVTGEILKQEREREDNPSASTTPGDGAGQTVSTPVSDPPASSAPDAASGTPSVESSVTSPGAATARIDEAAARSTAFAHAGVSADAVFDYSFELESDNGVLLYEIEFQAGNYEYDYEINAVTGAVVRSHRELED